jgi:hypothetical protein
MHSIFATQRKVQAPVLMLLLLLVFLMYATVLLTNSFYLPESFDNDAGTIRLLIHGYVDNERTIFDGFKNTALLYRVSGAEFLFPEWLILLFANVGYWVAALRVLRNSSLHRQNCFTLLFCMGWVFCSALFLSRYSKEMPSLIPVFIICFAVMKTRLRALVALSLVLLFVIFIRQYWAITLALFFGIYYIFFRLKASATIRLIAMLALYFLPFLFSSIVRQQYLTDWRVVANLDNFDPNRAKSAIDNLLLNSGPFTDYANALYTWLYLNFPINLLFSELLHHKLFVFFQLGSVAVLVYSIYAEIRFNNNRRVDVDPFYTRCVSFVLAYSLTQAVFEPDVGSFLRHQIILAVPLIYILYPKRPVRERCPVPRARIVTCP